ncbi:MAG: ltrA 3 [Gammaproteobacteria bacterium]|jgi:RNA-directed DNA polymerase|nr:ltrA 3 [Gammaproteobacteria bacterium]
MTVMAEPLTDALPTMLPTWASIDWKKTTAHVRQLQMRIAKAYREGKHGKVKALQWILTHSFSAKLLAVKRVVSNKGAKTPGVDNIIWNTATQKIKAAASLKRRGYKTKPLRRIYIPKKQKGQSRPLSIPVMQCRAQQALHLLSLEPIAELKADKNTYGFRPLRSTADAIEQCFIALAKKTSSQYILEGDIKSCFDRISHSWLTSNTPMDKEILRKWLSAGYMEKKTLYRTDLGTPQGGVISPTLLNVTLSRLEQAVKSGTKLKDKVNISTYADDFIITGSTKEVLEKTVKPIVEAFMCERGLTLSKEKTKITHINEGFDFRGMNVRKYNDKLIIQPAKSSVKRFLVDIRKTIKSNATAKPGNLIKQLNPKIRGWSNYYRHVCAKDTFTYVDHNIYQALWRWAVRRHPNKSATWIKDKYYRTEGNQRWVFYDKVKDKQGQIANLDLIKASKTPIKRHIKIQAEATPFNPAYHDYFDERTSKHANAMKLGMTSIWWVCWWQLINPKYETEKRGLQ